MPVFGTNRTAEPDRRPLYRLAGVRKSYGERQALDVPFLEVREGTTCLLTGPNGAGKSTLLQILAFLLPPTEGTVAYRGTSVDWRNGTLLSLRREVTLLHQAPYLFDRSVFDNVAYGPRAHGWDERATTRRVAESLEAVGLAGFGRRGAKRLSGGERQRVALARALAVSPRVLLLDEPLSGVDKPSAAVIREVIGGLAAKGTTVVVATHDPFPLPGGDIETFRFDEGCLVEGKNS
ncbi:MAG: ABC transporter ATP-binding protein [Deltaproteobacteria bacterium]